MPLLYNWCRYLWKGRSIPCQSGSLICLSLQHGSYLPISLPPFLFGLACCNPVQWVVAFLFQSTIHQHQWVSTLSLCLMYVFLPRSAAKSLYLWSSPILSGCSSRCPQYKLQLPIFHPREALLVGCWVTTLPSFSCGVLLSSPPMEVVLHGVGLVHLSHVWWLPMHKGTPTSDATRGSWFWWRTCYHPCWFITS